MYLILDDIRQLQRRAAEVIAESRRLIEQTVRLAEERKRMLRKADDEPDPELPGGP